MGGTEKEGKVRKAMDKTARERAVAELKAWGEQLEKTRRRKGMSQQDVAEALGILPAKVRQAEKGRLISAGVYVAMTEYLGTYRLIGMV